MLAGAAIRWPPYDRTRNQSVIGVRDVKVICTVVSAKKTIQNHMPTYACQLEKEQQYKNRDIYDIPDIQSRIGGIKFV